MMRRWGLRRAARSGQPRDPDAEQYMASIGAASNV